MQGLGDRLKRRAKELELTDSEVARRLGMQQSRYAHYVAGTREPDLATLARVCRVLKTTPNALLGFTDQKPGDSILERIEAAAVAMSPDSRLLAAELMDALAKHQGGGVRRSAVRRRRSR